MRFAHLVARLGGAQPWRAVGVLVLILGVSPQICVAKSIAAAGAESPSDQKQAYLYLEPVTPGDLGDVLTRLASSKLNSLESVKLKTFRELPQENALLRKFGDLSKLDRVSLIAIRNSTGIDGIIQLDVHAKGEQAQLEYSLYDLRNGELFRTRQLSQPVDAKLFDQFQADLVDFATSVRRSYRATIEVRSTPAGATVRLDGDVIGTTPLVHEMKAGEYDLEISAKTYKAYRKHLSLSDGNHLLIDTALENPIAAHFLNQAPGFHIDANVFDLGYRYVYLGGKGPDLQHAHSPDLAYLLRFGDLDLGLRYAEASLSGQNPIDTFVGTGAGSQSFNVSIHQIQVLARYTLWQKYSFAAVSLGTAQGMSYLSSSSPLDSRSQWSYATDVFAEVSSRLFRGNDASAELVFDLGASYLGKLPFATRSFNIFGQNPPTEASANLAGMMAGLKLRLVLWNDVF